MTILITGSSGHTAAPLSNLLSPTYSILVASRNPSPSSPHPTVKFNWLDPSTWDNPFTHSSAPVTSAYLVSPDIPEARAAVCTFIRHAAGKGVKRFVLLSAWEVECGGPMMGKAHQVLRELGDEEEGGKVEWAVLRPHYFMENFTEPHQFPCIRDEGKIFTAAGDGRKAYISARDIAAVAYHALVDPVPPNREYVLTGGESLEYDDIAKIFSDILQRPIEHVRLSREDLEKKLVADHGFTEDLGDYMAKLDVRVSEGEGWECTNVFEDVVGRKPVKLRDFVRENKGVWGK